MIRLAQHCVVTLLFAIRACCVLASFFDVVFVIQKNDVEFSFRDGGVDACVLFVAFLAALVADGVGV